MSLIGKPMEELSVPDRCVHAKGRLDIVYITREIYDNIKDKREISTEISEYMESKKLSRYGNEIVGQVIAEMDRIMGFLVNTAPAIGGTGRSDSIQLHAARNEMIVSLYESDLQEQPTFSQYYEIVHDTTSSKNVLLVVLESGFLKYALEDRNNLLMFLKDCIQTALSFKNDISLVNLYKLYTKLRLDENSFRALQAIASK